MTAALVALVVAASVRTFLTFEVYLPFDIDLLIPLSAAERWLAGGRPYVIESFEDPANGTGLPFLYPPWVLPFVALLTPIPVTILNVVWSAACVGAAVFGCRRLAIPTPVIPALLLWPPFLEGLLTGNVAIFLFAAFVSVFWEAPRNGREALRDLGRRPPGAAILDACRALFIGALKVSQVHAWFYLLRVRAWPALIGLGLGGLVVLVTLPFVGLHLWQDWLDQIRRASEPDFAYPSLTALLGRLPAAVIAAISLAAVTVLPRATAAAWIGVLTVVAAPSLHPYGLLFLLPAMLVVRREIALIAAAGFAAYDAGPMWIGIALIAWSLAAGPVWPVLWERDRRSPETATRAEEGA